MTARPDIRGWLRANGLADALRLIDRVTEEWRLKGKRTRRNWWDILAGTKAGNPRRVNGVVFPVVPALRSRSVRKSRKTKTKVYRQSSHGRGLPRPFLKWAGGKRQLISAIEAIIPQTFGTYHEPFLGGGAVFFALRPSGAFLSDSNDRLVRSYNGIKNDVEGVIALLRRYRANRTFFQKMRALDIDEKSDVEVAAWMIFLNKTGFNGLYRVNSKNKFNVPFGDNRNVQICDADNLRACADALKSATVLREDFSRVAERAVEGDLVYFDPPYVPISATSYFTSYTAAGFSTHDQERLRNIALKLKKRGVHVILSNSSAAAALYRSDFVLSEVLASRAVNSRPDRRGKIAELLIS